MTRKIRLPPPVAAIYRAVTELEALYPGRENGSLTPFYSSRNGRPSFAPCANLPRRLDHLKMKVVGVPLRLTQLCLGQARGPEDAASTSSREKL